MSKCRTEDGTASILIGGVEIDPCVYRAVEIHHNVSVCVSHCVHYGETMIEWSANPEAFAADETDL